MNEEARHHGDVLNKMYQQLKVVFDGSEQGIYLYLDNIHKVCNKRFASLLGYDEPRDWAAVEPVEDFVAEQSLETLVSAYQNAMSHYAGSTIRVSWKKKNGSILDTTVILVPIGYEGHLFALHFISPV